MEPGRLRRKVIRRNGKINKAKIIMEIRKGKESIIAIAKEVEEAGVIEGVEAEEAEEEVEVVGEDLETLDSIIMIVITNLVAEKSSSNGKSRRNNNSHKSLIKVDNLQIFSII